MPLSMTGVHQRRSIAADEASSMQALCAVKLYTVDKGMKGVVSFQLCLGGQLKSGVFPAVLVAATNT